ncbi:hypothetical protein M758_3G128500 [Ceratodon purpureus]|nr:hypothetical protein M758_3G128500 [Ceratodon purpureus]
MDHETGMPSDGSCAERDHQALEPRCKVFMSHSGAQKSFVEQLCLDVERCDRVPFFDKRRESLPIGEHFPSLIFQAIQQSQVGVLVLSKEFFTRTKWPMLELVAMMKLKLRNPNFRIIPVFLGISHTQCRDEANQGQWLSLWRNWAQCDSRINLQEWTKALQVFGSTNGISYNEMGEVKCREEIVEAICKLVPLDTKWDDSHVQGRSRFCKEIRNKIDEASLSKTYGVQVVGLYGVGGIGKTTICKALCNEFLTEFYGKVHHLELESSNEVELIRAMLKRLTDTRHDILGTLSFDQCYNLLKRDLCKRKVFVTIDNVYNEKTIEQAKAYLKARYGPGSIVIVTSRSLGLLQNLKIDEKNCIEMPELEEDEAKSIFLYHAELEDDVDEEFIMRCVERCYFGKGGGRGYHYHPLALKVLGTQVGYESEPCNLQFDEVDVFNQLREKKHPIFSILRKSFDTLLLEDQLLLMDAALFYPERSFFSREWEPINIFDWLSMMHGISVDIVKKRLLVLKKKSLLEDLGDGSSDIGMHDLWREFCVMESRAGEFQCQRWIYEDINSPNDRTRVESSLGGGGWENLQKICLMANHWAFGMMTGLEVSFNNCSNVTVLKLQGVVMEDGVLDVGLLKHLKSMECIDMRTTEDYQVEVVGLGVLKHLVVLIWDGIPTDSQSVDEIGWLRNLQVLQLHSSLEYNNVPDLSKLSLLRHVVIDQFNNANRIAGLNASMSNLRYMDIRCCKSLRSCPGIDDLVSLQELNLSRCTKLREVPSLQMLQSLRKLNIFYCGLLEALPGLGGLVGLQELRVIRCMKISEFPNMSNLINLQLFKIEECPVKTLPGLDDLVSLQNLVVCECAKLERLPDMRKLTRLEFIDISYCPKLREIWEGVNRPRACEELAADFHGLPQLETLKLDWIVFELPDLSIFPRLKKLHLQSCGRVTSLTCSAPLTALEVLRLQYCWSLKALPDLSRFERLRKLKMSNCGMSLQDVHEIEVLMARCNVSMV